MILIHLLRMLFFKRQNRKLVISVIEKKSMQNHSSWENQVQKMKQVHKYESIVLTFQYFVLYFLEQKKTLLKQKH